MVLSNSSLPNQGYRISKETRVSTAKKMADIELDRIEATLQEVAKRFPDMKEDLVVQIALHIHYVGFIN